MITYRHQEDMEPDYGFDAVKLNRALQVMINRSANAFIETGNDDPRFCNLIASILQAFWSTHRSIYFLLEEAARDIDQNMGIGSDAKSLAREQVEKIFLLSLLLDDCDKWVARYLRHDWRKHYELFLLEKCECVDLPRLKNFLTIDAPQELESLRMRCGITEEEKEAVEFNFFNFFNSPTKAWPAHLQGKLIPEFPTPGNVTPQVKDKHLKLVLSRWYLEYKSLCSYTHIGINKLTPQVVRALDRSDEQNQKYFLNAIEPSFTISIVASLSACTEVYRHITPNANVIAEMINLWNELEKGSLLGKVFWHIQAKGILQVLSI